MIAKQFLITGMMWAIIGGLMSLVFRMQLGFPDESIAWLGAEVSRMAKW